MSYSTLRLGLGLMCLAVLGGCASSSQLVSSSPCGTNGNCRPIGGYALPKTLVHLKLTDSGGKTSVEILEANQRVVPDIRVPLSYLPSDSALDEVTIDLEDGYLKSVKASADDKTAEIFTELLKVLKAPTEATGPPGSLLDVSVLEVDFDPLSSESITRLNASVERFGVCVVSPSAITDAESWKKAQPALVSKAGAVWYRPLTVALVELRAGSCTGPLARELMVTVPGRDVAPILISRAAFVKSETELTFDKGQLTKVFVKKPSTSLAAASIPYNLVKAVFALPTDLIQLKIDTSGKEQALAKARTQELTAQIELLNKLTEYEAAKNPTGEPKP